MIRKNSTQRQRSRTRLAGGAVPNNALDDLIADIGRLDLAEGGQARRLVDLDDASLAGLERVTIIHGVACHTLAFTSRRVSPKEPITMMMGPARTNGL